MESANPPSPQSVAREFVRQYWTVMNKAPHQLHRFYSVDSVFLHGDDRLGNEHVRGQAAIHDHITNRLNFEDCHARILLIDAQPTVSDGVLIQVTGELSNAGSLMRRFMQSFLLLPQGANKYYVHNAIFRYQDQVFNDTVEEDSELEGVLVDEPASPEPMEQQEQGYTSPEVKQEVYIPQPEVVYAEHEAPCNVYEATQTPLSEAPPPSPLRQSPTEGAVAPAMPEMDEAEVPQTATYNDSVEESSQETTSVEPPPRSPSPITARHPESSKQQEVEVVKLEVKKQEHVKQEPAKQQRYEEKKLQQQQPDAPRSYAAFFKSAVPQQQQAPPPQQAERPRKEPQRQPQRNPSPPADAPHPSDRNGNGRRPPFPQTNGYQPRPNNNRIPPTDGQEEFSDERRNATTRKFYPDDQQVFVGNLLAKINRLELEEIFTQFGKIMDIRITNGKSKAGNTANFGFITFGDHESVRRCIAACPILTNEGYRLNVEDKKPKPYGPPRGFPMGGGGRGGPPQHYGRMEGGRGRGGYGGGRGYNR